MPAVRLHGPLEAFLAQDVSERSSLAEGYQALANILGMPDPVTDEAGGGEQAGDGSGA